MVFNIATKDMSFFQDFSFLSVFSDGGKTYGVRADGIYEIGGDTDDGVPIPVDVMFGADIENDYHNKRVMSFYFDGVFAGDLTGVLRLDSGEEYEHPHNLRCTPGKGAVSTAVAIGVKGVAPFTLQAYSYVLSELKRRWA